MKTVDNMISSAPMKKDQQVVCGTCGCGKEEGFHLHAVCYRGSFRRFCTDCVLKNFRGVFCPVCLYIYSDKSPPPPTSNSLLCISCPAITHRSCVKDGFLSSPLRCPPCSTPNFTFFRKKGILNPGSADDQGIDIDSAKALVTAARIAVISLAKTADAARTDAEVKLNAVMLTKKKATEALERVAVSAASLGESDRNKIQKKANVKPNSEEGQRRTRRRL